jgi:hypothetical protein
MICPKKAKIVRPASLHEAQVVGMIYDLAKVGVLKIDSDLHVVAAVADKAVQV